MNSRACEGQCVWREDFMPFGSPGGVAFAELSEINQCSNQVCLCLISLCLHFFHQWWASYECDSLWACLIMAPDFCFVSFVMSCQSEALCTLIVFMSLPWACEYLRILLNFVQPFNIMSAGSVLMLAFLRKVRQTHSGLSSLNNWRM